VWKKPPNGARISRRRLWQGTTPHNSERADKVARARSRAKPRAPYTPARAISFSRFSAPHNIAAQRRRNAVRWSRLLAAFSFTEPVYL